MCIQELGENRAEACARLDKKKTELVWTLNTLWKEDGDRTTQWRKNVNRRFQTKLERDGDESIKQS